MPPIVGFAIAVGRLEAVKDSVCKEQLDVTMQKRPVGFCSQNVVTTTIDYLARCVFRQFRASAGRLSIRLIATATGS
jgi:hypothetical protein